MTDSHLAAVRGVSALLCDKDGTKPGGGETALDLIGDALGRQADTVAVPVERVADDFFSLRSGVVCDVVQKFVDYRLRPAVIGGIASHVAGSDALRDFVRERTAATSSGSAPTARNSSGGWGEDRVRTPTGGPPGSPRGRSRGACRASGTLCVS
ncbi:DUF4180 domain-containing protein [Streptomyces sp. KMM 9044]|uniref:DUF4180 domain-containing protein n=1 Tax=Streptomyces sp. KMM 9044 TaxID=2744474 RepID=UPI0021517813|nr:DUF4180 domain-containing protein [Streptomyces sp. KMM 9044]WAX81347.1 DUF4180 domain-containing protein [Streptomyces sp. KMM 9044]